MDLADEAPVPEPVAEGPPREGESMPMALKAAEGVAARPEANPFAIWCELGHIYIVS